MDSRPETVTEIRKEKLFCVSVFIICTITMGFTLIRRYI